MSEIKLLRAALESTLAENQVLTHRLKCAEEQVERVKMQRDHEYERILRVVRLCRENQAPLEDGPDDETDDEYAARKLTGPVTDADTIWPSEVLKALEGEDG